MHSVLVSAYFFRRAAASCRGEHLIFTEGFNLQEGFVFTEGFNLVEGFKRLEGLKRADGFARTHGFCFALGS